MSTASVPGSVRRAGGRLIVAILIALGATWGGAGVREVAAAESSGCININAMATTETPGLLVLPDQYNSGDILSVTAGDPSTGNPTRVQIALGLAGATTVADVPYPGTASYTIPVGGFSDWITFRVDTGSATLDLSCNATPPTATTTATPTDTATAIPTETATALPTATSTPQPTSTATATETALPINTATETAIPTIVAPATETAVPVISTATPDPTDEAEAVSELPNTGAGPDGESGSAASWLLLIGLSGLSLFVLRHRRLRIAR